MPSNLIFITPDTIEDNGIPGDNTSVIHDGTGVVIYTFVHPADSLGFTVSSPGVHLTINLTDSLGAADLTVGSLTSATASPDSSQSATCAPPASSRLPRTAPSPNLAATPAWISLRARSF